MRALWLFALSACRFVHGAAVAGDVDGARSDDAPIRDGTGVAPDSAPPFCDPADSSLVACYEFENTVVDGTSHHLDPDVTDNVSYVAGKIGQALDVGVTTEVDVAESSLFGVSAVTIEAWIDPLQLPTVRGGILDCNDRYGFFLYANAQLSCIAGGTASGGTIQPNTWTHVACTMDGTNTNLYIGGKLVTSVAASPLSLTGSQTGITLGGNNPPGGGDPLGGYLDQVRLFGVARTAPQICADSGSASCP